MRLLQAPGLLAGVAALLIAGCAQQPAAVSLPAAVPTAPQLQAAHAVGLDAAALQVLRDKPLHRMKPREVGRYIAWLQHAEPDLRRRIAQLARRNLGQPYELHLLGEFPYELHDEQPLYELEKSDCVVFVEHTYAMALSSSWEEFFWMLQRLRYRDGVIGVATRNHYTEADWNRHNAWLVGDVTSALGVPTRPYRQVINRSGFLRRRYGMLRALPIEQHEDHYVPAEHALAAATQLNDGDFVNVISGRGDAAWASHVGLIVSGPDGTRHLLHSQQPEVTEEPLATFIARTQQRDAASTSPTRARLLGFKFLRLNEQPEPPPMAPQPRPRADVIRLQDLPQGPQSSNR